MADSVTTVQTLTGELAAALTVGPDESADAAMRRVDRLEREAIRRHLFGGLIGAGRPVRAVASAGHAR